MHAKLPETMVHIQLHETIAHTKTSETIVYIQHPETKVHTQPLETIVYTQPGIQAPAVLDAWHGCACARESCARVPAALGIGCARCLARLRLR